jgi:hypothetical protein
MSSLSGKLVKAFTIAAGFVVGGYLGSLLFDPFFFPIIHDPANTMGAALKLWSTDNFGAAHEWMGLKGGGGLLNTEWLQSLMGLKPYIAAATPPVISAPVDALSVLDL